MAVTKGLEGVVAATSTICSIVEGSLTYRGYNIDDLAEHSTFEEVAYLLWFGKLPTLSELECLKQQLSQYASIPDELISYIKLYPQDVNMMSGLRSAVSALALYDECANRMTRPANELKAIQLQAKLPTIIAAMARIRKGKQPLAPLKEAGIAENFLYMVTGKRPSDTAIKAMDKALILHADHEFNASTFAARVTVATLSDMYSGVTSAIGALKGPLHGGANEAVMDLLDEIQTPDRIEEVILHKLHHRHKIMGFGHRVYKNGDPRAKHLRYMSKQLSEAKGDTLLYDMSIKIEQIVAAEKGLLPNVDFYSASVYTQLDIDKELFTPIFAMSRVSGWTAHILEQYEDNRIIRPRAEYVGMTNQKYVSVEFR